MGNTDNNESYLRFRKILARFMKMEEDVIKPESTLRDNIGVDSIDIWEIIVKVEEEFGIELPTDEMPQLDTVNDVVSVINDTLAKTANK